MCIIILLQSGCRRMASPVPRSNMESEVIIVMKKLLSLVLALTTVLSLGLLAGCTKNEEPVKGEDNPPKQEETLKTVKEGELIMSTNAAFPPYEMTNDAGKFVGIDVEIAEAIADKLGLKLAVDDMDFDSALLAVQQGKSDLVMAGVSVTPDRQKVMDFSNSYATGIQVVIVAEGSDVTLENLGDKKIGTQRATTGNIYCTDDFGEEHVVAYDNGLTAVQALKNGQVDCVVIDSAPAKEFVAANPGLTILDTEYAKEEYAIGMNKGNTALVDAVNKALDELKQDGTIQDILDKYIAAE